MVKAMVKALHQRQEALLGNWIRSQAFPLTEASVARRTYNHLTLSLLVSIHLQIPLFALIAHGLDT